MPVVPGLYPEIITIPQTDVDHFKTIIVYYI